jgi:hypothetical protein
LNQPTDIQLISGSARRPSERQSGQACEGASQAAIASTILRAGTTIAHSTLLFRCLFFSTSDKTDVRQDFSKRRAFALAAGNTVRGWNQAAIDASEPGRQPALLLGFPPHPSCDHHYQDLYRFDNRNSL